MRQSISWSFPRIAGRFMKLHETTLLLLYKAAQDELLLGETLAGAAMALHASFEELETFTPFGACTAA